MYSMNEFVWYRDNGNDPEQFEIIGIREGAYGSVEYLLDGIDQYVSGLFLCK